MYTLLWYIVDILGHTFIATKLFSYFSAYRNYTKIELFFYNKVINKYTFSLNNFYTFFGHSHLVRHLCMLHC